MIGATLLSTCAAPDEGYRRRPMFAGLVLAQPRQRAQGANMLKDAHPHGVYGLLTKYVDKRTGNVVVSR